MSTDDLDQIARLFRLREGGALTQAEFETEKARILAGVSDGIGTIDTSDVEGTERIIDRPDLDYPRVDEFEGERPRSKWWVGLLVLAVLIAGGGAAWFITRESAGKSGEHVAAVEPAAPQDASIVAPLAEPPASTAPAQASLYAWATSTEVLGVTPEYLISKLGAPRRRDYDALDFVVEGCDIRYGASKQAINDFDAEFSDKCKPSLRGLNVADTMKLANATTLADVSKRAGGTIVADCIEMCGNAADPVSYLFIEGPHADNFINVAIKADPRFVGGTWGSAIRSALNLPPDGELPEASYQCGKEAQDVAQQEMGSARISRIRVNVTMRELTMCDSGN